MLEIRNLRGGYHPAHPVLHGVDVELVDGECLALLGRNGMGKSTFMRAVMGVLGATGTIALDGVSLLNTPSYARARKGLAYVPQGRDIFSGLTVYENLKVAAACMKADGWRRRLEEVLADFPQLRDKRSAPAESLSGGQQQILAIARALVSRPKILLLDEPTEGIQPSIRLEIADLVRRASTERGLSVLVAEQNLDFASRVADEALILEKGAVIARVETARLQLDRELQSKYLAV